MKNALFTLITILPVFGFAQTTKIFVESSGDSKHFAHQCIREQLVRKSDLRQGN
jgi:hypothetical protein